MHDFLAAVPACEAKLASYSQDGNREITGAIDAFLHAKPRRLNAEKLNTAGKLSAMSSYRQSRLAWQSYAKSNLTREEQALIASRFSSSRDPFANFQWVLDRYRAYRSR